MKRMKRMPLIVAIALFAFFGCSDPVTSLYSFREQVFCQFNTLEYATTLNMVMGNYGEYATLRMDNSSVPSKIEVKYRSTTEAHTDALITHFQLGLGGLIVGTNQTGEYLCYDLACPICDRNNRRLTLTNDGFAHCPKCGVTFDLNNYGVIHKMPETNPPASPRGLYRYYVAYDPDSHIALIRNAP